MKSNGQMTTNREEISEIWAQHYSKISSNKFNRKIFDDEQRKNCREPS